MGKIEDSLGLLTGTLTGAWGGSTVSDIARNRAVGSKDPKVAKAAARGKYGKLRGKFIRRGGLWGAGIGLGTTGLFMANKKMKQRKISRRNLTSQLPKRPSVHLEALDRLEEFARGDYFLRGFKRVQSDLPPGVLAAKAPKGKKLPKIKHQSLVGKHPRHTEKSGYSIHEEAAIRGMTKPKQVLHKKWRKRMKKLGATKKEIRQVAREEAKNIRSNVAMGYRDMKQLEAIDRLEVTMLGSLGLKRAARKHVAGHKALFKHQRQAAGSNSRKHFDKAMAMKRDAEKGGRAGWLRNPDLDYTKAQIISKMEGRSELAGMGIGSRAIRRRLKELKKVGRNPERHGYVRAENARHR
jgi:hypothetical protein